MNFRTAVPLILAIGIVISCGERDAVPADHPLWDWNVEETEAPEGSPAEEPSVDEPSQSPPIDDPLRDEEKSPTATRSMLSAARPPTLSVLPIPPLLEIT
jgi:hypothetical protein